MVVNAALGVGLICLYAVLSVAWTVHGLCVLTCASVGVAWMLVWVWPLC